MTFQASLPANLTLFHQIGREGFTADRLIVFLPSEHTYAKANNQSSSSSEQQHATNGRWMRKKRGGESAGGAGGEKKKKKKKL